jgi:putative endonuclease
MNNSTKVTGNKGEEAVAQWLQKEGFTLLEQNFTVRQGEVDIIASKDELVVFVEVKTRKNQYFPLSQVITPSKQRKIITAAKMYLMRQHFIDKVYRFDVALVTEGNSYQIDYVPNAFNEETNRGM